MTEAEADSALQRALSLEQEGDFSEAITLYEEVAAKSPEHATYASNCAAELRRRQVMAGGEGFSKDAPKQRLGCLTVWLVLMILANAVAPVSDALRLRKVEESIPNFPAWVIWPSFGLAMLNIVFAVALLNWKKWGFFGILGASLAVFALKVYLLNHLDAEIGIPQAATGLVAALALAPLVGVIILFVLLRIGGEESAWSQLE
jgi:hypothetical protein